MPGNSSDIPSAPVIKEPYHTVVQLRFGDKPFILTVPPNYLLEATITERRGGYDRATLVFIDPSFTKLETLLLQLDKEANKTSRMQAALLWLRWGFPGIGLESCPWRLFRLATYSPTLTTTGMRISIELYAQGTQFKFIVEPKVYKGKISSVVQKIAEEMGYPKANIFVEETDDDDREEKQDPWSTKNKSRHDLVQELKKAARSKENPGQPYRFRLSMYGTFHFHTADYSKAPKKRTKYRVFKVLFGDPETSVISFTPTYNAKAIGSVAESVLATTFDPRTKQYQKRVLTRKSLGLSTKNDPPNARTTGGDIVSDLVGKTEAEKQKARESKTNAAVFKESKVVAQGGACSGKTKHIHTSPESAFAYLEHSFKTLHHTISSAQLELLGLPGYEDFTADEGFCDVHVELPPESVEDAINVGGEAEINKILREYGVDPNYGLHWSSGRYIIESVVHTITSGYTISAELKRATMLAGPDEAKTGPPKKPKLATVKTTR